MKFNHLLKILGLQISYIFILTYEQIFKKFVWNVAFIQSQNNFIYIKPKKIQQFQVTINNKKWLLQ